jgi:hypothetical protein
MLEAGFGGSVWADAWRAAANCLSASTEATGGDGARPSGVRVERAPGFANRSWAGSSGVGLIDSHPTVIVPGGD